MEYKILKKLFILSIFLIVFIAKSETNLFLITEIMYNPEGNDEGREWLEVYNQSNQTFYLKSGRSGWRINDGENHLFNEELIVNPQEVFIIVQDKNKFSSEYPNFHGKIVSANFSLKNTSGKIQIFDENKNLLGEVIYQNSCGGDGNGYSIIFENGICQENKVKKGAPGIYPEIKPAIIENPEIETSISSNDQQLNINFSSSTPVSSLTETATFSLQQLPTSTLLFSTPVLLTLYISEFLPNPQGNDYGQEFIELYNYGDEEINLESFILEIGSKRIKLKGVIEPQEYFVITNENYSFNIRNQGEKLTLYYKEQKIFSIDYQGKAPEGKSFSRFNENWQFTEPTPGNENILVLNKKQSQIYNSINENYYQNENLQANLINESLNIKEKNNIVLLILFLLIIILLSSLVAFFIR